MREARDGDDVEANELVDAVDVRIRERVPRRDTGIVDEHADALILAQACLHARQISARGQIRWQDLGRNLHLRCELGCQCVQTRRVAGNEHEIMATARKSIGVDRAGAGGCACDEHRRSLLGHEQLCLGCPQLGRISTYRPAKRQHLAVCRSRRERGCIRCPNGELLR